MLQSLTQSIYIIFCFVLATSFITGPSLWAHAVQRRATDREKEYQFWLGLQFSM